MTIVAMLAGALRAAAAQTGTSGEVGEFVLPIGARVVGMGMTTATAEGSEAPWWNPALVGRSGREAAFQLQSNVNGQASSDAAGVLVWPFAPVGVVALAVRYLGYGSFEATDFLNNPTGSFNVSAINVGATFATTFGNRIAAGFTFRRLMFLFSCSGECSQLPASSADNALDFGGHAYATKDSSIAIGIGIRNLGPKLQLVDAPQADMLPKRIDVGVAYSPKLTDPNLKDVRITAAADVVGRIASGGSPGYRFGGEVTYLGRYAARAGYMVNPPVGSSGLTFGVGLVTGKLRIDFAQMSTDANAGATRPTLIALRYSF
jgi:hypothetical protein